MGNRDVTLPRFFEFRKQFLKDWDRLVRSGRFDMRRLHEAMMILIANRPLGAEWRDHRECHIGGDFLLVYKIDKARPAEAILFVRAGTHAELFE